MKKLIKFIIKILLSILVLSFIVSSFTFTLINNSSKNQKDIGVKAVTYLYQFNQVEDLDNNMEKLKTITTDEVFNQLTVDNEERTLNTYLKFKGKSTDVEIIKSTETYVLYSLDTEYVDSNRVFIFMFDVNNEGKLSYVRECECLDFLDY